MTKLTKLGKANKKQLYQWLDEQGIKKAFITNLRLRTKRHGKKSRDFWEENYILSLNHHSQRYYHNPIVWAFDFQEAFEWSNDIYWGRIANNYDRYLSSLSKC